MKRLVFLLAVACLLTGLVVADITPANNPAQQVSQALLDKYMPRPAAWATWTQDEQRNFRQSQLNYLVLQLIKKDGPVATPAPDLDNYMQVGGSTHKSLQMADRENADAVGASQKKAEEALKKANEALLKPVPVVDYWDAEAQAAIEAWAKKNGPALIEAYLKENGYVKKDELDKVKNYALDLADRVSVVVNTTNTNTADLIQLHQTFVWQEVDGEDGRKVLVPVSIQPDMVPQNFQKAVAEVASIKSSLDQKADKTEVSALSTKVDKVDTKVNSVREAVAVVALGKKDRALIYVYASFVQEGNEAGFKDFLKKQRKEKIFEEVKKAAQEAEKEGCLKLTPQ